MYEKKAQHIVFTRYNTMAKSFYKKKNEFNGNSMLDNTDDFAHTARNKYVIRGFHRVNATLIMQYFSLPEIRYLK